MPSRLFPVSATAHFFFFHSGEETPNKGGFLIQLVRTTEFQTVIKLHVSHPAPTLMKVLLCWPCEMGVFTSQLVQDLMFSVHRQHPFFLHFTKMIYNCGFGLVSPSRVISNRTSWPTIRRERFVEALVAALLLVSPPQSRPSWAPSDVCNQKSAVKRLWWARGKKRREEGGRECVEGKRRVRKGPEENPPY